jgi:hypothetical protein
MGEAQEETLAPEIRTRVEISLREHDGYAGPQACRSCRDEFRPQKGGMNEAHAKVAREACDAKGCAGGVPSEQTIDRKHD